MILLISSSFDAWWRAAGFSAMEITLPSTTPDLNLERRNFLGDLGEGLGEGHRVGIGVGDGVVPFRFLSTPSAGVPVPASSARVF